MGDLISRSALIEEIEKLLKSPYAKHPESYTGLRVRKEAIETVRDLCVKQAPTAYDVDKVIEEVKVQIPIYTGRAVEIIKKGKSRSVPELKDILGTIEDIQLDMSKVILCNEVTKKILEESGKVSTNVYILVNNCIEDYNAVVVQSREMKKLFIEIYEENRRKEAQRE